MAEVVKGLGGRIVAVKKSTVLDEDRVREFINELIILSQLNPPEFMLSQLFGVLYKGLLVLFLRLCCFLPSSCL